MASNKAIIQNTPNRLINILVTFLITVILTRVLGSSDFGILTLVIANASLLNLISSLGISSGITYYIATKILSANKIALLILILLLAQLFFVSIVEYLWHLNFKTFWLFKGSRFVDFFLGISFFISISVIEKYNALFYGKQQFALGNIITLGGNIVLLFFLSLLFILQVENSYIYFVIYVCGFLLQALASIITYHFISDEPIIFKSLKKTEFQLFFSYSFLAFVTNLLQFMAYRADFWFVDYYKGSTQLGLYSVSVRLAQLFWIIPNLFAAMLFPQVASKLKNENLQSFTRLVRIMNTFNLIIGVLSFLLSPVLISWIFGGQYSNSVTSFQILLPGVIAFCITTILASYFAGKNKLIINFWGTVLCLLIILFLDLALIPNFGIKGAAIASCIGYTASTVYSLIIFKQFTKVGFNQMILIKKQDLIYLKRLLLTYVKV